MRFPLCKFCSAAGAEKMLSKNCIFISSPLDLNDPFEMRPAWTQAHEDHEWEYRNWRNQITSGQPFFICTTDGPVPGGVLPKAKEEPKMKVEQQVGIADTYNQQVFEFIHANYRVLSLVRRVIDLSQEFRRSRTQETLMWAHYADMFQGVGILLDPRRFNNGSKKGGFTVKYRKERRSLPIWFYDMLKGWENHMDKARHEELVESLDGLLSSKSPVWRYEHEVRMLYRTNKLHPEEDFTRIPDACPDCRQHHRKMEDCKHPCYRDAVRIPPEAIVGVVFGAECPSDYVARLLEILKEPRYSHVRLYWSAFDGQEYRLTYRESKADEIEVYQQEHTKRVARAKGHIRYDEEGMTMPHFAAQKGINLKQG